MPEFIPIDRVEWVLTRIIKENLLLPDHQTSWRWQFDLPRPLADWDVFSYWERERLDSMQTHLRQGMTLFDVGTEQGWMDLIYAGMVGPNSMVLVEPTPEFHPNIRATWERNYSVAPIAVYDGLVGDTTTDTRTDFHAWPAFSVGPLIDRNKYQYLHDNAGNIPQMRLDDLVSRTGVAPAAITIDVEGAELLVLQGAEATLREHRPLVWVSVHPDLMARDYGATPEQVITLMESHGYTAQFLAEDHECHWFFEPA